MRKTESLSAASEHLNSPGEALRNLKPLIDEVPRVTGHGLAGVVFESASHDIIAVPGPVPQRKGLPGATTHYFEGTNYVASWSWVVSIKVIAGRRNVGARC